MNKEKIKSFIKKADKFVVKHITLCIVGVVAGLAVLALIISLIGNLITSVSYNGTWENEEYEYKLEIDGSDCRIFYYSSYEDATCEVKDGKLFLTNEDDEAVSIAEIIDGNLIFYGDAFVLERD